MFNIPQKYDHKSKIIFFCHHLEQLFIVYMPYIIVTQIMRPIKCMIEDIEKGLF